MVLDTLGDHLRAKRLDQDLLQKGVAERLGASHASVRNWEKGHRDVALQHLPALIDFLGYDPRPEGETLGEKLYRARSARGLPQKKLARSLGLDQGTLSSVEDGRRVTGRVAAVLEACLREIEK